MFVEISPAEWIEVAGPEEPEPQSDEWMAWLRRPTGPPEDESKAGPAAAVHQVDHSAPSPSLGVLCYTAKQTAQALQISATTLWRLEKTGRLLPLPDSRHKRYPVDWVQRYATGQPPHPAMARLWTLQVAPAAGRPPRKRSA